MVVVFWSLDYGVLGGCVVVFVVGVLDYFALDEGGVGGGLVLLYELLHLGPELSVLWVHL